MKCICNLIYVGKCLITVHNLWLKYNFIQNLNNIWVVSNIIFYSILPLSYGVVKHSGNTASVQPFDFACCIRFTAMAMFFDLSAVTVNCNTAARKPNGYNNGILTMLNNKHSLF